MAKKEYSIELAKMLKELKTKEPTVKRIKGLTQDERETYMAAVKKKAKADRKKLQELMKGIDL